MEEVMNISKTLIPNSQKCITPLPKVVISLKDQPLSLNKLREIVKDRGAWHRLQSMGLQRVWTEHHEILQCYYQSQQDIHNKKKKVSGNHPQYKKHQYKINAENIYLKKMTATGNSLNAQQHEGVKVNGIISIWSQFRQVCLGLGGIPPSTHTHTGTPQYHHHL